MAQLSNIPLETIGIQFSGRTEDWEVVTLKAEGEKDGKQVHLPAHPGAAALGVCSKEEPVKASAEAKSGSALCSSSRPAGSGCAVCGCSYRTLLRRLLILLVKRISCYFLSRSMAFDLELRTLH